MVGMNGIPQQPIVDELLDFSKPFNITLLDNVVTSQYEGNTEMQKIQAPFTEHDQAWTRVGYILEHSNVPQTRMIALKILDDCIKSRWHALPSDQTNGIRNFIISQIQKISSDIKSLKTQQVFLTRLNVVLVEIAKREWPHNWSTFISEIVNASKSSTSICINNMKIFQLLSEEIFDFSRGQMTSEKALSLKRTQNKDFGMIYEQCDFILKNSQDLNLLEVTLETLVRFLRWIPQEYIFEKTNLIESLACKFFTVSLLRFKNLALECLSEIAYISNVYRKEYELQYLNMMVSIMRQVYIDIPENVDMNQSYLESNDEQQQYIRNLAVFITDFLRNHIMILENSIDGQSSLLASLRIQQRMSMIDDSQQGSEVILFNICLTYWNELLRRIYMNRTNTLLSSNNTHYQSSLTSSTSSTLVSNTIHNNSNSNNNGNNNGNNTMQMNTLFNTNTTKSEMLLFYDPILKELRNVQISKMAKPEEVLIVEDENGNIIREKVQNSDALTLYLSMRECLIYLTNLDPDSTIELMVNRLHDQTESAEQEWKPTQLNRLCWAIGSISRAQIKSHEKSFLVRVIKYLLRLVSLKPKKDQKAIVASNIMYVVGQYPRFLKDHLTFLETVLLKLFEFMHEKHPGVQDMSCDTFLKIAQRCKKKLMISQNDEPPFIEKILKELTVIVRDLEMNQVFTFYEAVAYIISSELDKNKRDYYIDQLMSLPNQTWIDVTTRAKNDINILLDINTIDMIDRILKTNSRVARAQKNQYLIQLSRIYIEMLLIYTMYSKCVSNKIKEEGENATRTQIVRKIRSVKKEILLLMITYVDNCTPLDSQLVINDLLPQLGVPVLEDYKNTVPSARDAEVLHLFTSFINQFHDNMSSYIPQIFIHVFPTTLEMIDRNFEDYPEHRLGQFKQIQSINLYCFSTLLELSSDEFKLVVDFIIWAIKHLEKNIQELGQNMVIELINNFKKVPSPIAQSFYQQYLIILFNEQLDVQTDTFHRAGFSLQCQAIYQIQDVIIKNIVTKPLHGINNQQYNDTTNSNNNNFIDNEGQNTTNVQNNLSYFRNHVNEQIKTSFPALPSNKRENFVNGQIQNPSITNDTRNFKTHIRNFQIELKEYSGGSLTDDDSLNTSQLQEDEISAEVSYEKQFLQQVPGLEYIRDTSMSFNDDDND